MAQQSTPLGYPYFEGTDSPAGHTQQQTLAEFLDANPGIGSFTQSQIDAFTTAQKKAGRVVYNSTTGKFQRSNGSTWENFADRIYISTTEPSGFAVGDAWLDTSASL